VKVLHDVYAECVIFRITFPKVANQLRLTATATKIAVPNSRVLGSTASSIPKFRHALFPAQGAGTIDEGLLPEQLCLASRNKRVLTRERPEVLSLLAGDDLALITAGGTETQPYQLIKAETLRAGHLDDTVFDGQNNRTDQKLL
jgi:hypothetical protein